MNELFIQVLRLSWQGSLIAVVVMLLRGIVFRKAPRWTICLLWAIVGLRLLIPFSPEAKVSVMNETVSGNSIITAWQDSYVSQIRILEPGTSEYNEAIASGLNPVETPEHNYIVTDYKEYMPPKTVADVVTPKLCLVWQIGIVAMLGYMAFCYIKLSTLTKGKQLVTKDVFSSPNVKSPFVSGIIPPRIYVPTQIPDTELNMVLLHEKAHISRGDFVTKPLAFLILSVHWFNPVLWIAYILMSKDMESACDEHALRNLNAMERAEYSRALVSCAVQQHSVSAYSLSFGEEDISSRVKRILNYRKPSVWISVLVICAAIIVAVCFLTRPESAAVLNSLFKEPTVAELTAEPVSPTVTDSEEPTPSETVKQDEVFNGLLIQYDADTTYYITDIHPNLDLNSILSECQTDYLYSVDIRTGQLRSLYSKPLVSQDNGRLWEDDRVSACWFLTQDGELVSVHLITGEATLLYRSQSGDLSWLKPDLDANGNTIGVHFIDGDSLIGYDIATNTVHEYGKLQHRGITQILSDTEAICIDMSNTYDNTYYYDFESNVYTAIPGEYYDMLASGLLTTQKVSLSGPVRIGNGFILDGIGDIYTPASLGARQTFFQVGLETVRSSAIDGSTMVTVDFQAEQLQLHRVMNHDQVFVWADNQSNLGKYSLATDPCSRNVTVYRRSDDGSTEIGVWTARIQDQKVTTLETPEWIKSVSGVGSLIDMRFSPSLGKCIAVFEKGLYYSDGNRYEKLNDVVGLPDGIRFAYFADDTHIIIESHSNFGDAAYVYDIQSDLLTQTIPAREGILYFENHYAVIGSNDQLTYVNLMTGAQTTMNMPWSQLYAYGPDGLLLVTNDNMIYQIDCIHDFAYLLCKIE